MKTTTFFKIVTTCCVLIGLNGFAQAAEIESSIARGGLLYDKWYAVIDAEKPTESHPSYPADKKYADKPEANWRCKECHGWDNMGVDGAYASASHNSGIKGINGASGQSAAEIIATLKGDAHGYGDLLSDQDMTDLANFVSKGQIDMDQYIDRHAARVRRGGASGRRCRGNRDGKRGGTVRPL